MSLRSIRKKINILEIKTLELKVARKLLRSKIESLYHEIDELNKRVDELSEFVKNHKEKGE